ncbi:hypothetical protein GGR50DRAFT_681543 [Xylaria sp. CBS 124048]|nr:hypothetical protein GGR50DRAFT_681543 [Xylaria sp. CBS 124048]
MMRPSPYLARAKRKQLEKFECIDIWRNELSASALHCVCSAPTLETKKPGRGDNNNNNNNDNNNNNNNNNDDKNNSAAGPIKIALPFAFASPYRRLGKRATFPSDREDDRTTTASTSTVSGGDGASKRSRTGGCCPVCSLPNDGVVYVSLGQDGSGLVRTQRSLFGIKFLDEAWRAREWKGKELLFKVSPAFLRSKRFRLATPKNGKLTEPAGPKSLDGKTPPLPPPLPPLPPPSKLVNATDMYQSLRRKAVDEYEDGYDFGDDFEDEELLRAFSNSDGKKPQVSIMATGARLLRAKKLLGKPSQPVGGLELYY